MMDVKDEVTLYLHGLPSQRLPGKIVLACDGRVVTLRDEYTKGGKARYRLSDGRRLRGSREAPWDFWRVDPDDCARLRGGSRP